MAFGVGTNPGFRLRKIRDDPHSMGDIANSSERAVLALNSAVSRRNLCQAVLRACRSFAYGYGRPKGLYQQYIVESSLDGKKWTTLQDRSHDKLDTPNDYVELPHAIRGRFVRFRSLHVPTPYLAISDFRIFGNVAGDRPSVVTGVTAVRKEDRRNARISWVGQPECEGYNILWGIAPDKLYSSWMVYGQSSLSIRSLNVDQRYNFAVEAFDVHGVGPRSQTIEAQPRREE